MPSTGLGMLKEHMEQIKGRMILGGLFGIQWARIFWEPGHTTGNRGKGGSLHSDPTDEGRIETGGNFPGFGRMVDSM